MAEESKKTKILNYINVFRGLAILLIVAGHTMQFGEAGSLTRRITVEIFCGGTALFIFISGFLFQHLSGKYEFCNYMKKKWNNVILPYLYTAIPGIFFCLAFPLSYGNSFDGINPLVQIPMMITVGRVHNTPAWFIPMICLFFLSSAILLKLEKKGILYKLLPLMFLITVFLPRVDVDYSTVQGLSYTQKYFAFLNYVLLGYVHFFSMYVFGMFCSAKKEIIDKFYDLRWVFIPLTVITSALNVFSQVNYGWGNGTVGKIFLTIIVLAYLKHYDEKIISMAKLNKVLDFIAKYSFGIFFVHWYVFYLYKSACEHFGIFTPANWCDALGFVSVRFLIVTLITVGILAGLKKLILKINPEANTRSFIGV